MSRTIIFGDIHGCYDEWLSLLDRLNVQSSDLLFSVGDIIFKGPKSAECLDLAMSLPNLKCVLGNHEYYLLKNFKNGALHIARHYHESIVAEFGEKIDDYIQFIKTWPLYIELPNCMIIHAGLRPGISLAKQDPKDLLFLRNIEPENIPWHDHYKETKLAVYGHWAQQGLKIKENSIGLDTGCVYGRELSALVLPEKKIVSVPAKKNYCPV